MMLDKLGLEGVGISGRSRGVPSGELAGVLRQRKEHRVGILGIQLLPDDGQVAPRRRADVRAPAALASAPNPPSARTSSTGRARIERNARSSSPVTSAAISTSATPWARSSSERSRAPGMCDPIGVPPTEKPSRASGHAERTRAGLEVGRERVSNRLNRLQRDGAGRRIQAQGARRGRERAQHGFETLCGDIIGHSCGTSLCNPQRIVAHTCSDPQKGASLPYIGR